MDVRCHLTANHYEQFKNEVNPILGFKNKQKLTEQIIHLAWEVSFMPKKVRINKILDFIKKEKLNKITDNKQEIDTLELILALCHFRRAKYNTIT
jgi:hypothetical protein